MEVVRARIGRDTTWNDVEVLKILDGDSEKSTFAEAGAGAFVEEAARLTSTTETAPVPPSDIPPPPPIDPPPPLPVEPPPPLPSTPPPPLPPGPPPPRRLVQYPTTLFSSFDLPIHRPDLAVPFSHPAPFVAHSRMYQCRPSEGVAVEGVARVAVWELDEGEVEMDMSSSGDEA